MIEKLSSPVRREAVRKRTSTLLAPRRAADPSGWLTRHRRLVRDYERRPEHHEAMAWWATATIMTRRLTRELTSHPPPPRRGQPRQTHSTTT
jgi:hypothetical protein